MTLPEPWGRCATCGGLLTPETARDDPGSQDILCADHIEARLTARRNGDLFALPASRFRRSILAISRL